MYSFVRVILKIDFVDRSAVSCITFGAFVPKLYQGDLDLDFLTWKWHEVTEQLSLTFLS